LTTSGSQVKPTGVSNGSGGAGGRPLAPLNNLYIFLMYLKNWFLKIFLTKNHFFLCLFVNCIYLLILNIKYILMNFVFLMIFKTWHIWTVISKFQFLIRFFICQLFITYY
jgi:hypothetical protein